MFSSQAKIWVVRHESQWLCLQVGFFRWQVGLQKGLLCWQLGCNAIAMVDAGPIPDLSALKELREVVLSHNLFTELPPRLPPNLNLLNVEGNNLGGEL
jgi:hypothetical protein